MLNWIETHKGTEYELEIPAWDAGDCVVPGSITIEKRPWYCDRGRFLAKAHLPLDDAEGWPRYYFSLETAMSEIEKWLKVRKALKTPIHELERTPTKSEPPAVERQREVAQDENT